jgi:preprotein translocase subunit SecE
VLNKEESMNIIKTFINYCKACYDELAHKTTWPTYKELTQSAVVVLTASLVIAVVVLSASLIIALVVWAMDLVFKSLMGIVYPG